MADAADTVLVTGATGFIGSRLARRLVEQGRSVRITVRPSSDLSLLHGVRVHPVEADVTDASSLRRAMRGVGAVFHVAALVEAGNRHRDRMFAINEGGVANVLDAARSASVGRVVVTSSIAAVGPAPDGVDVADEDNPPLPRSLRTSYVLSKLAGERRALDAARAGQDVVIVNPAWVLGEGDLRGTSTQLVREYLAGRIPGYFDGGLNFVGVDDVVQGHLLAERHGRAGRRYILGNANLMLRDAFERIGELSGVRRPMVRFPAAPVGLATAMLERIGVPLPVGSHDVTAATFRWFCSSGRAERELGYRPGDIDDDFRDTIEWWRSRGAVPHPLLRFVAAPLAVAERVERLVGYR
jgi:dihydroflavonol-4-reductase